MWILYGLPLHRFLLFLYHDLEVSHLAAFLLQVEARCPSSWVPGFHSCPNLFGLMVLCHRLLGWDRIEYRALRRCRRGIWVVWILAWDGIIDRGSRDCELHCILTSRHVFALSIQPRLLTGVSCGRVPLGSGALGSGNHSVPVFRQASTDLSGSRRRQLLLRYWQSRWPRRG